MYGIPRSKLPAAEDGSDAPGSYFYACSASHSRSVKTSHNMFPKLIIPATCLVFLVLLFACTRDNETLQNTEKQILSFRILTPDSTEFPLDDVTISLKTDSILVQVPYGTPLNPLIPVFTFKGFSATPGSGLAQDFSRPVRYTVTAEDGSSRVYVVVVRWGAAPLVYFGGSDFNLYCVAGPAGRLIWKFLGSGSFVYSSPTFAGGTIYAGNTDGYVYALHPATGALKWKKQLSTTGIESDAVCVNGTVYVGTNDDSFYALDTISGNIRWSFQTGGNNSSSPVIADGTVYFGSSDGNLYALDAATGQRRWTFGTGAMINQSGPALVNGILYVGSRDGRLYAVRASDGTQVWAFDSGGISLEQSSPTVDNGIVYIGGWYDIPSFARPGSLYAVDAATGELRWEALKGVGISGSPHVANGIVYVTADDGKIHAFQARSGSALWSVNILHNGAGPVAYGNVLYVGGGGMRNFYALDAASGNPVWTYPLPNSLMVSSPLLLRPNGVPVHSGESGANQ
jgi:outer membrane protein assembly factor BamB